MMLATSAVATVSTGAGVPSAAVVFTVVDVSKVSAVAKV
jgi:hypothetical protein